MIESAADTLEFNSIESLDQGSSTLYTITRLVDQNVIIERECDCNFKWFSMQTWQWPIENGTLETFIWSKMGNILLF